MISRHLYQKAPSQRLLSFKKINNKVRDVQTRRHKSKSNEIKIPNTKKKQEWVYESNPQKQINRSLLSRLGSGPRSLD